MKTQLELFQTSEYANSQDFEHRLTEVSTRRKQPIRKRPIQPKEEP